MTRCTWQRMVRVTCNQWAYSFFLPFYLCPGHTGIFFQNVTFETNHFPLTLISQTAPNSRKQNVTKEPAISPKLILAVAPNFVSYVMHDCYQFSKKAKWRRWCSCALKRSSPCFLAMDDKLEENTMDHEDSYPRIDVPRSRYPYCIVWTPIPVLTWVGVTTLSFGLKFFVEMISLPWSTRFILILFVDGFFLLLVIWELQCPQEWSETSLVLFMFR